jgi:hypothetical protein
MTTEFLQLIRSYIPADEIANPVFDLSDLMIKQHI